MKLSKKILALMGGVALLTSTVVFTGCSEDDDENEMISGSGSNYTIDYKNTTTANSRGYKSTALKHYGGVCTISMNAPSQTVNANGDGVMGFIFDLHDNATNKNAKDFFIVGITNKGKYYVSKFSNVTNLNGNNFGVADNDGAKENQIVPKTGTFVSSPVTLADAENTNYKKQVVVNVVANDDGSYDVYLLPKLTYDSSKKLVDTSKALAKVSISNTETGYSAKQQNKLAVYANVYKENCTLKGAWTFSDIDGSASVVEE